jgi:hypothetical protein
MASQYGESIHTKGQPGRAFIPDDLQLGNRLRARVKAVFPAQAGPDRVLV